MKIQARISDLWREAEGGWSENASWARSVELDLPDGLSDTAVARRIKSALGIEGMRVDHWCGADWCWRSGAIGAYADVVS